MLMAKFVVILEKNRQNFDAVTQKIEIKRLVILASFQDVVGGLTNRYYFNHGRN